MTVVKLNRGALSDRRRARRALCGGGAALLAPSPAPSPEQPLRGVSSCVRCGEPIAVAGQRGPLPTFCPRCRMRNLALSLARSAATAADKAGDDELAASIRAVIR